MKNFRLIFIVTFFLLNHSSYSQETDTSALDYLYNTDINNKNEELERLKRSENTTGFGSSFSSFDNLTSGHVPENNSFYETNQNVNDFSDDGSKAFNEFVKAFDKPTFAHLSQPETYDPVKTNRDRFVNSPCYYELGFNPFADPEEQELKYKRCEEEKREENVSKMINKSYDGIVTILGVLVFGLILFVIGYFTLNFISTSPTLELKDVLKAITIGGLIFIGLVMLKFLKII